jgi:N-acetylglutamate synthase-like GNAT family acetyltransferase
MTSKESIIRPARIGEATLLTDLVLRSKRQFGHASELTEEIGCEECPTESQIVSEYMRFFVLEKTESIIGFYALKHQSRYEIELAALFVEPAHFGKGSWHLLLDHAKSVASQLGAERLLFQSDPNVVELYMAAGAAFTGMRESATTPGQFLPAFRLDLTRAHAA